MKNANCIAKFKQLIILFLQVHGNGSIWKSYYQLNSLKISLISMEGEGHYRAHKGPSLLSVLSQVKAVHPFPSHIFRYILNIIFSLCLGTTPFSFLPKGFSSIPRVAYFHPIPIQSLNYRNIFIKKGT